MLTVPTGCYVVGAGFWLRSDAAEAYFAMLRDGCPSGITSATRSFTVQMDWYLNQGKRGYPKMADHPARSKHVWRPDDPHDKGGRALDLPLAPANWVRAHGARYGWHADRVPGEWWHMEFEGAPPAEPDPTPEPAPVPEEDDDMTRLIRHPDGRIAAVGPGPRMTVLRDLDEVNALRMTGLVADATPDRPWQQLPDGLAWNLLVRIATRAGQYTAP